MLTQVCQRVKRVFGSVNVFKKKNCGASPIEGEQIALTVMSITVLIVVIIF